MLEACRQAPDVRLKIAGCADDAVLSKLPKLLSNNAEYIGMKQGDELRELVLWARAIVLPSLSYENQPFSILEAFAAGKPVIASYLGGMTELAKNGERGILVPPGDVKALAEAMDWMNSHPLKAKEMGERARVYASEVHSSAAHYKKLMWIYEHVLQRNTLERC